MIHAAPRAEQTVLKVGQQFPIGTVIEKQFGDEFFRGTVEHFDSKAQYYKIEYTDGDKEELIHCLRCTIGRITQLR